MFDTLTDKLGSVLSKLTRRGALTAADVTAAMREVRVALLEADVALPVVRDLVNTVRERAVGEGRARSWLRPHAPPLPFLPLYSVPGTLGPRSALARATRTVRSSERPIT